MNLKSSLERLKQNLLGRSAETATATATATAAAPLPREAVDVPPQFHEFDKFPEYREYTTMEWYYSKQKFPRNLFLKRLAASDATVNLEGRELVNFSTYNYLALAGDPRVKQAAKQAIDDFGTGTGSGRSITGEIGLHQQFEQEICEVLGTEDCVLSVGGYSTNAFTIAYLARNQDLILYDELVHNSALAGCKMTGARRISFPHNDYDALERLLAENRSSFERVLILVEGVYSMDGDLPDLPRIVAIKERYKALLMVDEAHSMGVVGPRGLGVTDYFGVPGNSIDILFGSLSKSFGTCGGYVAGPKPLVAMLKMYAPGVLLYGASPTPANTAAALESLRIMRAEPERALRLQANAALFIETAKAAGLDTYLSRDSAVVPIMMRDSELALWMSIRLFEQGYCTYPMLYPIVPRDRARLRFFINTNHTREQILGLVDCIVKNLKVAPASRGVM